MRPLAWALLGAGAAAGAVGAGLAAFSGLTARRVEAALPPQGRFLVLGGERVHYLDQGPRDLPAIVMVHGLGGQMRHFTYALVDRLKDRFRVVVMERPGAGYSSRSAVASARLGAQAEATAAFIAALGLDRPLLVGHSLGGALALAVAVEHPEAVGGLALLSPLTQPQDTPPAAFAGLYIPSPLVRRLVAWTLATPLAIRRRDAVLAEVFGPEPAPEDFATRGGGLLSLRPKSFYSTSTDLVAANEDLPRLQARYRDLTLPAGVLFGVEDRILAAGVHGARMATQVPGLVYETIEGAGHMIPLTQPDRVTAFIKAMAERTFERSA